MDFTTPSGRHKAGEKPDLNVWLLARIRYWIVVGWLPKEGEPRCSGA